MKLFEQLEVLNRNLMTIAKNQTIIFEELKDIKNELQIVKRGLNDNK